MSSICPTALVLVLSASIVSTGCVGSGPDAGDAGTDADGADAVPDGSADASTDAGGDAHVTLPPGTLGPWSAIGPSGGDRFLVQVDPFDPQRVAVVGHGGVHVSTDRGDRWQAVHTHDMQGSFAALAFDPTTRDRLAVGCNLGGVFVSDDFGATWSPRSQGLPGIGVPGFYREVQSLVFTPDGRLWAALRGSDAPDSHAVFSSSDQGQTWAPAPGIAASADSVTQLFRSPSSLYAVSSPEGPFRYDGGDWISLAGDLPADAMHGTYLAVDPADPGRIFLGTLRAGLYRTADGGTHWARVVLHGAEPEPNPYPLVYWVQIDPNNPDLVWVDLYTAESGTETPLFKPDLDQVARCGADSCGGHYVTLDGGQTWFHPLKTPIGHFRMTIDPSETVTDALGTRSRYIYLTAGGAYCVHRADAGLVVPGGYEGCRRILGIHGYFVNALRELNGRLFVAEEGHFNYADDYGPGVQPVWHDHTAADQLVYIWDFALDAENPDILLWATGEPAWEQSEPKGIWRSNLAECEEILPECVGDPPLERCPKENLLPGIGVWRLVQAPGGVLYALTQEAGIKRGTGQDTIWSDLSQGLAETSVTSMLLDDDHQPLAAGARECAGEDHVCPWSSRPQEPGAAYYFQEGEWRPAAGIQAAVNDLARDPAPGGAIYAATSQGLFRSDDDGRSYQAASDGLPGVPAMRVARSVVADPRSPGVVYAGTVWGIYRTVDAGAGWTPVSGDLVNVVCDRLIFSGGDPDRLFLATLGGSVFVAAIQR